MPARRARSAAPIARDRRRSARRLSIALFVVMSFKSDIVIYTLPPADLRCLVGGRGCMGPGRTRRTVRYGSRPGGAGRPGGGGGAARATNRSALSELDGC